MIELCVWREFNNSDHVFVAKAFRVPPPPIKRLRLTSKDSKYFQLSKIIFLDISWIVFGLIVFLELFLDFFRTPKFFQTIASAFSLSCVIFPEFFRASFFEL